MEYGFNLTVGIYNYDGFMICDFVMDCVDKISFENFVKTNCLSRTKETE